MFSAVLTKFQNSPRLKKLLIETKEKYIVEAVNYDFIYGIILWEFSSEFIKRCKSKDGTFDVLPEDWNDENMLDCTDGSSFDLKKRASISAISNIVVVLC